MKNLYIIEHDALEVLENMIRDSSVSAFHIFFPDPWPKKRHHKRRLVQRPRTDLISKKLSKGGYAFDTNVIDLFNSTQYQDKNIFEQFENTPGLKNKYLKYAEKQSWRPETKFERKGLNAQRLITELMFEKDE